MEICFANWEMMKNYFVLTVVRLLAGGLMLLGDIPTYKVLLHYKLIVVS